MCGRGITLNAIKWTGFLEKTQENLKMGEKRERREIKNNEWKYKRNRMQCNTREQNASVSLNCLSIG